MMLSLVSNILVLPPAFITRNHSTGCRKSGQPQQHSCMAATTAHAQQKRQQQAGP